MGKGNDPNCSSSMPFVAAAEGLGANDIAHLPPALRAEAAADILMTDEYREVLRDLDRSLIVDMDDTLITNQALFDRAHDALAALYADMDVQGRAPDALRARHAEIDNGNIAEMGYSPKRWYFSAFQAAQEFTGRKLTDVERQAVKEAAGIAMGTGEILPGAEKALDVLRDCGVAMLLKTKGAPAKQQEKLGVHRFDRFFGERIEIVPRKDPNTFREMTERYGLRRPVSIGDSGKSDIEPALALGFEGILIDKSAHGASTWSFEVVEGLEVPRVSSFSEAVLLVASRARNEAASPVAQ